MMSSQDLASFLLPRALESEDGKKWVRRYVGRLNEILSDEKKQPHKSDGEVTEWASEILINMIIETVADSATINY
jgi:hypothetical protein